MKKRLLALLLVVSALLACTSPGSPALPITTLTLPRADHTGLAWTKSGAIVVARYHDPAAERREVELWRLNPDGSGYRSLGIERDSSCVVWNQLSPVALSDGRVAYWSRCGRGVSPPQDDDYLAAVDIDTGVVSRLAPLGWNPSQIAWLVEDAHGWFGYTSDFCAGIAAVDSTGVREYPLIVGEGSKQFRVDSLFHASAASGDCSATGLANLPAVTADGSRVAFFAAPDSLDRPDPQRPLTPYSLYVAGATATKASPILDGVVVPATLAWSPNGQWLVFAGKSRGSQGVWIIAPDGSRASQVAGPEAFNPAWSPDGQRILVNTSVSTLREAANDKFAIIDVSAIVGR